MLALRVSNGLRGEIKETCPCSAHSRRRASPPVSLRGLPLRALQRVRPEGAHQDGPPEAARRRLSALRLQRHVRQHRQRTHQAQTRRGRTSRQWSESGLSPLATKQCHVILKNPNKLCVNVQSCSADHDDYVGAAFEFRICHSACIPYLVLDGRWEAKEFQSSLIL